MVAGVLVNIVTLYRVKVLLNRNYPIDTHSPFEVASRFIFPKQDWLIIIITLQGRTFWEYKLESVSSFRSMLAQCYKNPGCVAFAPRCTCRAISDPMAKFKAANI